MKIKKLTQRQIQSLRDRSAKPGRLRIDKPKVRINKATINYNTWYTRKNALTTRFISADYNPSLLNENGFRCCLGFICQSLGTKDEPLQKQSLSNRTEFIERFNIDSNSYNFPWGKAVEINDEIKYSIANKIGLLIELFNPYDFELYFINLPTYIYNEVEAKYLDRVSANKGPHVFASTTPMWKN